MTRGTERPETLLPLVRCEEETRDAALVAFSRRVLFRAFAILAAQQAAAISLDKAQGASQLDVRQEPRSSS